MTFTNYDLSTPLLGNPSRREVELKLEHERDEQYAEYDEEVCMRGSKSNVHDSSHEEYENEQSSDHENQTNWWFDICLLLSMFVSTFLSLQFGMVLYNSPLPPAEATTGLRWSVVNFVLYVIIAARYRQSVVKCDISCLSTLPLPAILIYNMLILFLVLFDEVVAAFWLLLGSMLCLAAFTVASKIGLFWSSRVRPLLTTRPRTNSL
jgi:cation transport ATPase